MTATTHAETSSRQTAIQRLMARAKDIFAELTTLGGDGFDLMIAEQFDKLGTISSGHRMEHLARAQAVEAEDRRIIGVPEQVHDSNRQTLRKARTDVRMAQLLATRFQTIAEAWKADRVSEDQARAIVNGLRHFPAGTSFEQLELCQETMLRYATSFDPDELRRLAQRLVEVIDPELADQRIADRVEREARIAFDRRFLTLTPDHHGSMIIHGQLPIADGQLLQAQLDALQPALTSYDLTPPRSTRRADALIRLTQIAANSKQLPNQGGDRPQIIVALNLADLRTGLASATLLGSGAELTAREARRLACDANLIPAVLGTAGEVLDMGRSHRLFTGPLRAALTLRDQGCAFPGCDAPPATCEAHHITPWHAGGPTSLANGVLLCPFHHRMVEPDPNRPPGQNWQISLDQAGQPWFTPPGYLDLARRPRQHHRYRIRGRTLPETGHQVPKTAAQSSSGASTAGLMSPRRCPRATRAAR